MALSQQELKAAKSEFKKLLANTRSIYIQYYKVLKYATGNMLFDICKDVFTKEHPTFAPYKKYEDDTTLTRMADTDEFKEIYENITSNDKSKRGRMYRQYTDIYKDRLGFALSELVRVNPELKKLWKQYRSSLADLTVFYKKYGKDLDPDKMPWYKKAWRWLVGNHKDSMEHFKLRAKAVKKAITMDPLKFANAFLDVDFFVGRRDKNDLLIYVLYAEDYKMLIAGIPYSEYQTRYASQYKDIQLHARINPKDHK